LIGAGSVLTPGVTVGENCIVGAGSVVLRNIKDGEKVYGIVK
jgi:acetyltransferase-like isoleucine patch superfamily enzyme